MENTLMKNNKDLKRLLKNLTINCFTIFSLGGWGVQAQETKNLIVTIEKDSKNKIAKAQWGDQTFPCAIGWGGIGEKVGEGDGITPIGEYPIRRVLYRADRILEKPKTVFEVQEIQEDDGWCDEPRDPHYNQQVKKPFAASHEDLWRKDNVYDVIVVIGQNDDPIIPNKGSAVFMHVARENFTPTAGCVGLSQNDLLKVLEESTPDTHVIVKG